MSELAIVEKQLTAMQPQFQALLAPAGVNADRLIRTVLVSVEKTPKLLQCTRQSLINSAVSAACLGLEVDGSTGQAYLIPFKNSAQLVIGYKGYNTMAARSGFTVNGNVVREGDDFDYMEGSEGFVRHKRQLGGEKDRKIIGAWATASANGRPPIVCIRSIDEIMATKARSPGGRKSDSPWNDPQVGFPAMCEKTAKRGLARSMPLNVMQMAAAMEDQLDLGQPAHVDPERGVVIDGESEVIIDAGENQAPPDTTLKRCSQYVVMYPGGERRERANIREYIDLIERTLKRANPAQRQDFIALNRSLVRATALVHPDECAPLAETFEL